jgi:hypothetical protein
MASCTYGQDENDESIVNIDDNEWKNYSQNYDEQKDEVKRELQLKLKYSFLI